MNDLQIVTQLLTHCNEGLARCVSPDAARMLLLGALTNAEVEADQPPLALVPERRMGTTTDKPKPDPGSVRSALRARRVSLNWTQTKLAKRAKVSKWTIHQAEAKRHVNPDHMAAIVAALEAGERGRAPSPVDNSHSNVRARRVATRPGPRPGSHYAKYKTTERARALQAQYSKNYYDKLHNSKELRDFVDMLRTTRQSQNMTAEQLSKRLNRPAPYIARIEQMRSCPSSAQVHAIANALGVKYEVFPDLAKVRERKPKSQMIRVASRPEFQTRIIPGEGVAPTNH